MEEQYFEFDFLFGKLSLSERKSRMIVLHTKISLISPKYFAAGLMTRRDPF